MTHGLRATYQQGCRCLLCRAAEASYRQQLRTRQAKRLPILGQYISASEAWARIRTLKQEQVTHQRITGWTNRHLPLTGLSPQARVRVATLMRLRRLCAYYLIPDEDLPNHQPVELNRPGNVRHSKDIDETPR